MADGSEAPAPKKGAAPKKMSKWEAERGKRKAKGLVPVAFAVAGIALLVVALSFVPPANAPAGSDCASLPRSDQHYHAMVSIKNQGTDVPVADNIGIDPNLYHDHSLDACSQSPGMSALHTHPGEPGVIHIETTKNRDFTLGEFFRVWGQPLGPGQTMNMVAGNGHTLHMTVNGVESQEWGNLVLKDQQQIEISYA